MEARPGDRQFLRDVNIVAVADAVRHRQPISRIDLAEHTGLGRSTITAIVQVLLQQGLVREIGEAESSGGRPPVLLELVDRARLVVGVRLAARTVTLGLADLRGRIIQKQRRGLRVSLDEPEQVLEQISIWIQELMREGGATGRVLGIGIAVPGHVEGGTCVRSPDLGWSGVETGRWLQGRLGLPVLVDTDAGAFTLGEATHGSAAGRRDVLGVTLGAHLGGALLLNGQVYRGPWAAAGDLAHLVVEPEGPPCSCGQRGCLQAVAGDGALVAEARAVLAAGTGSLMRELVDGRIGALTRKVIIAAAQDGDAPARAILTGAARRIGAPLGQLTAFLAPAMVVLGGEAVDQAGPLLTDPLEAALRARLPEWLSARVQVVRAGLGELAWVTGAASMVLERVFAPPTGDGVSLVTWEPAGEEG